MSIIAGQAHDDNNNKSRKTFIRNAHHSRVSLDISIHKFIQALPSSISPIMAS